jgi:hypothetical protein
VGLLINRPNKWAYIHIPKTAGNSISQILLSVPETEQITTHGTLNELKNVDGYFIFTFVRNPYTRLASWFEHRKREGKANLFSNFIKSIDPLDFLFFSQEYYINHGNTPTKKISYVGKYENLNYDLNYILNKIEIKENRIPHLNRNKMWEKHPNLNTHKLYKQYYNEDWMKDWVREKYQNDFKIFNYELDI